MEEQQWQNVPKPEEGGEAEPSVAEPVTPEEGEMGEGESMPTEAPAEETPPRPDENQV